MAAWVYVIAALVGAGGPLAWLLDRFDKRNTAQHKDNLDLLKDIQADVHEIQADVKTIDGRLDRHIEWHVNND